MTVYSLSTALVASTLEGLVDMLRALRPHTGENLPVPPCYKKRMKREWTILRKMTLSGGVLAPKPDLRVFSTNTASMLHVGGSRVGKGLDYPLLLSLLLHHMRVMDLRPMHPLGYFLHVLLLPVTLLDLHGTTAAQLAYASIPTTEHTIHLLHRLNALQRVGEGHESVSLRALSQLVLHHAAHRERGVALAEQIGQDFSCHLPAQIAHEQPEIGRVPVC